MPLTRYTSQHEWLRLDGEIVTLGMTDFARRVFGDVAAVELPPTGEFVSAGVNCASVKSANATSGICAPVSGLVLETNSALFDDPTLINRDPEGAGWFLRLRPTDREALDDHMNRLEYAIFTKSDG